jgi:hypothetical protein
LAPTLIVLALLPATSAWAAGKEDPLFIFPDQAKYQKAVEEALEKNQKPPPPPWLEAPCGLAVDATGRFYLSEYYRNDIKAYDVEPEGEDWKVGAFGQQPNLKIPNIDPLSGPCGLDFNSADSLYVNNFHHNVLNLTSQSVLPLPAEDLAHQLPTGVAIDQASGRVYVVNRSYVSVFDQAGQPVMSGPEPMRIGVGTLGDGYGIAIGSDGRVYVADASTKTVKIYDPEADLVNPVGTVKGPGKGFTSLRDSAIAIDRGTGVLYVVDNLQPVFTEAPEAVIDLFSPTKTFLGVLKYRVFDALPPAVTVDNSANPSQGRVYVASGNTGHASVYAYAPGAQTVKSVPPAAAVETGNAATVETVNATTSGAPLAPAGDPAAAAQAAAAVAASPRGGPGQGHRRHHRLKKRHIHEGRR